MAEFGEQLRKAREEKGMTQQSLAEKLYVTRQTVSRWEGGERYPDILTLKKISAVLGVSADTLLGGEEMPVLVEKTPIIERPIVNNILVALQAAIVIVFAIQAYQSLEILGNVEEYAGSVYFAVLMAGCAIVEAALFVFSFVNILRGTDTPKKTGTVIAVFFAIEFLRRIEAVFNMYEVHVSVFIILCFIPYILGCIGGYLYFISDKKREAGKIFVYIASAFEASAKLILVWTLSISAPSFVGMNLLLTSMLKLLICLTFIYATYLLGKRRERANGK